MQPCRGAFVAACAALAAANTLELEVRDVDVPAGPRELHQRYSEIFRYGNRNAALATCEEIQAEVRAGSYSSGSYSSRRIVLVTLDAIEQFVDFRTQVAPLDELYPRPRGRDARRAD